MSWPVVTGSTYAIIIYMKLKLVKKTDEAKGTKSFYFQPDEEFTFEAGQYIYITLSELKYPDERGDTRHFTISSSPTEGNLLRITTRIREESGYKKTLDELETGSVVEGRGPQGLFVLPKDASDTSHIFLAGGIGITPFRSMIKYCLDNGLAIPIHLIYSNSDSEFVFKEDLISWRGENENLKIDFVDTSVSGHIDANKLSTLISNHPTPSPIIWVVGPNAFVNAIEEILESLKTPEDQIKTEKFTGY